jgi:NAD(P)-dependent dehydrogenase (short-subunit alcohol dehydrogenase family)
LSSSSLFSLAGKRALITGASRGIGRAIALEFARAGADVAISSNEPDACENAAREAAALGVRTLAVPADQGVRGEIEALYEAVTAAWGGTDILACNAGVNTHEGPLTEIGEDAFIRMMSVNVSGVLNLCRLFIPQMAARRHGSVIAISSIAGLRGNRRIGAYGITKAANAQLARNLAVEWGPRNVRVNAISPGLIETAFAAPILQDEDYLPLRLQRTPMRRAGRPEEIAGVAVFLASPAGAFVNGHNLVVDGGTLIGD